MKQLYTWTIDEPVAAVVHALTADAAAEALNWKLKLIGNRQRVLSSNLILMANRSVPNVRILREGKGE